MLALLLTLSGCFFDTAAVQPLAQVHAPQHARVSESGLAWLVLREGHGATHPSGTDRVRVHYTGWLASDGSVIDSSVQRGEPATFPLVAVIPGWTEGLQLMVEGEKTRFWIPPHLAYGGQPGRPQGMLIFDVELLEILPEP